MPRFLLLVISGLQLAARAQEGMRSAHAIQASGMAEEVELLLSGPGVEWLEPLAKGAESAQPLRDALEAGVTLRVCTRAAHERGLIETLQGLEAVVPTGAPTHLAARAADGWTLLSF